MTERDEFSPLTKRAVALRAGYCCSFSDCSQLTVGPSEESSSAVAGIGDAAHICAAAPGGRRYDLSMSPEQRSHIENAIWLCANHARLIDRDSVLYTADNLREMKRTHEAACAEKVRKASSQSTLTDDLLAVGPGIVCIGELRGFDESEWTLDLKHFLVGDVSALIQFVDTFPRVGREDRFILVNSIGDGRALTSAPAVSKSETGYLVRCPVAPRSPRTMAQQLGSQWAISRATNDLFVEKGQIARVSGLASLPQIIRSCLSIQRGESPFHPNFGARFAEYFAAFRDSPWLGQLLKLEVIRQSAIPYNDDVMKRQYTPFHCVDRVWSVEILAEAPTKNRLPTRFELEVNGVGRWQCDVSIFLSSERPAAAVKIR